jgi:mannose-6-phosphate isomerase-like protein (cupin superfamily)
VAVGSARRGQTGAMTGPVVLLDGDGESLRAAAGEYTVRLAGADTDGRLAVVEYRLPPYSVGAEEHIHHDHSEQFMVLSGEVVFRVGDDEVVAGPGSVLAVPEGVVHAFRNDGHEDALLVFLLTPAGYEEYFRDVDTLLAREGEADAAALAELRRAYGTDTL